MKIAENYSQTSQTVPGIGRGSDQSGLERTQTVQLPAGCAAYSKFLAVVNYHLCLGGLRWCTSLWVISVPISNSSPIFPWATPIKRIGSLSWTLVVSTVWSIVGSLSGVNTCTVCACAHAHACTNCVLYLYEVLLHNNTTVTSNY